MRVLAGQWQGRALGAPEGIRPMTEMVKQAIFNALGDVSGDAVLDLFAGSGQLGIEALSRGATFVAFVEKERRNADHIRAAIKSLGASAVSTRALAIDALAYIPQTDSAFDLIFADPPYEEGLVSPCVTAIVQSPAILAPGGRLVLRHTKHEPLDESLVASLEAGFSRSYGDDRVRIWRKK
ncbi:MAG: 16S rRNA (guanine(966)-N(2))-methyltransferase RsmD [Candidatus Lindowbacteria bacterium RIFCSPLOWO2_12_FULL_62_27]|nr:MAG: 16S rRNA (guanine(966)-N(2))-methyltransferase RsmD [Candidatus Lindowbacteria bacterium RIFCSPLOWO2_12_FULL_62_27]